MLLLVLLVLALVLMVSGYGLKNVAITYAGGAGWMLLGAHSYTQSVTTWDVYYGLFFLAMFMVVLCLLEPVILKKSKSGGLEQDSMVGHYGWSDEFDDEDDEEIVEEKMRREMRKNKVNKLMSGDKSHKPSRYSQTGGE